LTEEYTSGKVQRIMLMIRLQRVGRRNHAEFRLVATEKARAAKSSNYVEHLGHYNPHTDTVSFNTERVLHWIENGAQVSDTVHNLLVGEGIIKGKKRNVLPKKQPIVKEKSKEVSETEATETQTDMVDTDEDNKEEATDENDTESKVEETPTEEADATKETPQEK
jgi:small subunit ribosomal protein S16